MALVKFKVAERFFKENPPSREISRFLRWNKGRYTSQTDNSTQLRQISSFYSQLEVAVDTLEAKHTSNVREISRFLRWNKGRYTSQTDNSTQLRQISSFYSQLEVAVDTLEAKHTSNVSRSKDREMQQLLPSQGMVLRMLKKIHDKIIRRLRSKPSLATPWRGDFTNGRPT